MNELSNKMQTPYTGDVGPYEATSLGMRARTAGLL
jgi:hypothetical protein